MKHYWQYGVLAIVDTLCCWAVERLKLIKQNLLMPLKKSISMFEQVAVPQAVDAFIDRGIRQVYSYAWLGKALNISKSRSSLWDEMMK